MSLIMTIKDIIDEDFINYKKPSMFIATAYCSFKCEKEDCNVKCQNSKIAKQCNIKISINEIVNRYINNPITKAVVLGGLEPFDQIEELVNFIREFRKKSVDDIVIYTGYTETEINNIKYQEKNILNIILKLNKSFLKEDNIKPNIIIKYGRFKSCENKKYDEILGINLASTNQYAKLYN